MKYVGKGLPSITNRKLATGRGTFTADVDLPGLCWMSVLRSVHAHAKIVSIDVSRARSIPGVIDVVTGEEMREIGPLPASADPGSYGGRSQKCYALAVERVGFVGEPIAAVLAEDRYAAHRALEEIEVEYETLPAVSDAEAALRPGAPLVEPSWPDNVLLRREFVRGDADRALASAHGVVRGRVRAHRYVPAPLEPRAFTASYDAYDQFLTLWASTQMPHTLRALMASQLSMPETNVRVIQPNVGGGFGLKGPVSSEEVLVSYLSRKHRRPVRYVEERTEHLLAAGHCRETLLEFEAGYAPDARLTGLKVRVIADVGAQRAGYGWAQSFVTAYTIPAAYKVDDCRVELLSVVTNKCPWTGYRAFGKEAAAFLMDRVLDRVADAAGVDRAEVRLRNFIPPEAFPYSQVSGAILDSGEYSVVMRKLLDLVDYESFAKEQADARAQGRYLGMGLSFALTPEGCALPKSPLLQGYDGTTVKIAPSGQVTVLTGVTSPGSGNETGIAQIVADRLGVRLEDIRVVQGDTDTCPYGMGNYSSRSLMMGGSAALIAANEIRGKLFNVAARALEVTPEDLDAEDGRVFVKGAPSRSIATGDIAKMVYFDAHGREACEVEPGLESTRYYRIDNVYHQPETQGRFSSYPTWPYEAAAVVVEVDPDTGIVRVLRYAAVHDCGTVVNPLLVDANLHGGIAQGIGAALFEQLVYDESGQLQTTTFMDYTLPTALEMPPSADFQLGHHETPSPFTPLGAKGAGESGISSPLGAIPSAVENAFSHLGLELMETPLTPNRVWRAIREASSKASARP